MIGVRRAGEQLELQVEPLASVAGCPYCGEAEVQVKERLWVRVRDLSVAG